MLATIVSSALLGIEGHRITVEVHVGKGIPGFSMVGLPDAACREARDRVRSAVYSSGYEWPNRKITVNLAPSSFPKLGSATDLAIAVGVLQAGGEIDGEAVEGWALLGELGLDGTLRPVRGSVPLVAGLREEVRGVVVPAASAPDASLVPGLEVRCARTLVEVLEAFKAERPWPDPPSAPEPAPETVPDMAGVRGHPVARSVLEIAAAGGHHLLMSGPPGSGKTMLASRLPGLLPDLSDTEALDVTAIHSAAGASFAGRLVRRPPFRAPHHTASVVALIGGGSGVMRPGEISLAHQGVLFADELGEFPPAALDALRQPLEEGVIRVSRARGTVRYPALFQLVAATNPCPCGPPSSGCRCSDASRARYLRRLSGPLLDRFDLRLEVERPDAAAVMSREDGEPSALVRKRVEMARAISHERGTGVNRTLRDDQLDEFAPLTGEATRLLETMLRCGALSARGVQRVRRVGRTIADLAEHDGLIDDSHIATALAIRVPMAGADVAAAS